MAKAKEVICTLAKDSPRPLPENSPRPLALSSNGFDDLAAKLHISSFSFPTHTKIKQISVIKSDGKDTNILSPMINLVSIKTNQILSKVSLPEILSSNFLE